MHLFLTENIVGGHTGLSGIEVLAEDDAAGA